MTDLALEVEKVIQAPIADVFDAWLDPQKLASFMMPMSKMEKPMVENDPRVGGHFKIIMKAGDQEMPHTGEYVELDRPNKLAFTWVSSASREDSIVTLKFTELSDKQTKVHLSQVKFFDEERCENHKKGWTQILETLSQVNL